MAGVAGTGMVAGPAQQGQREPWGEGWWLMSIPHTWGTPALCLR